MTSADNGAERITAWLVALPLRQPFVSAQTWITERRVMLVKVEVGEYAGWGEAAPVPGHTDTDLDLLWGQLIDRIDAFGLATSDGAPGMLGAAFEQAQADLNARRMHQPLWRILGSNGSVTASAAIGMTTNGTPDPAQIEAAGLAGYSHVKLKVVPSTDPEHIAALRAEYPQLRFGADANGSLTRAHMSMLVALDRLGLEYIEQPGPPDALDFHAELRRSMKTAIALDESAGSLQRIRQIVATGAADVINLKVGRFGTISTRRLAGDIVAGGLRARIGGLIETGVGRAHTAALAGHQFFTVVGDLAGSDRYFSDDLVRPQWTVDNGQIHLPDAPGIGVTVDEEAVTAHAEDRISIG